MKKTKKFSKSVPQETRALVISSMVHKGGTAKSTQTSVLSFEAAKKGLKTLVIDMDPQCDMTVRLGYSPRSPAEGSIRTALHNAYGIWSPEDILDAVYSVKVGLLGTSIQMVPGDFRLELDLASLDRMASVDPGVVHRLRNGVDTLRPYPDLILIDSPPSGESLIVDLILWATDVVVIPIDGWDAIKGACLLLDRIAVKQVEREAKGLRPIQVFLTVPHLNTTRKEGTPAWLLFAETHFPKHLVRDYISHSKTAGRAAVPGTITSNISEAMLRDYRKMLTTLTFKIFDKEIPNLLDWMEHEGLTPSSIRKEAFLTRLSLGRSIDITPVRATPVEIGTILNPPEVGEVLNQLSRAGGFMGARKFKGARK